MEVFRFMVYSNYRGGVIPIRPLNFSIKVRAFQLSMCGLPLWYTVIRNLVRDIKQFTVDVGLSAIQIPKLLSDADQSEYQLSISLEYNSVKACRRDQRNLTDKNSVYWSVISENFCLCLRQRKSPRVSVNFGQ